MPGNQEAISQLWQGYDTDESGWEDQITANFLKIGAIMQIAVISRSLTAPPVSPADGARYIVATGASGEWLGRANRLAVWRAGLGAWEYYSPNDGWIAVIVSEGTWGTQTVFKGGVWSPGVALG